VILGHVLGQDIPKIQRNVEVFTLCDFIAAITPHLPDKRFRLVRYDGWYSNTRRGISATHMAPKRPKPPARPWR